MNPFVGTLQPFAFSFAPSGWKLCDGSLLPARQYSTLTALLGSTWGGDGVTTVGIPDARGRIIVGQGTSPASTVYTVGQTGGDTAVTLKEPHLPAHTHGLFATNSNANAGYAKPTHMLGKSGGMDEIGQDATVKIYGPRDGKTKALGGLATVGSDQTLSILQPALTNSVCICLNGDMPPRA